MIKLKGNELSRITADEYKKIKKIPLIIVLDNIRSALNVGSVFRTSDAFLVEKIILCGITAKPPHKEIRKTALGSNLSVNWEYEENTVNIITKLKTKGYYIVGVEQAKRSTFLNNFKIKKKPIAIIMGNEIEGVSEEVLQKCDEILEIPQFGIKHSLNISVATGIIAWEIHKKIANIIE